MSAQRTKGPWDYDTGPSLKGRYHTVIGADEVMVCECYEGSEQEQEANARLIAAAPDLLEALVFLADASRATKGFASPMALQGADAAIAKAKGGEA